MPNNTPTRSGTESPSIDDRLADAERDVIELNNFVRLIVAELERRDRVPVGELPV